MAGNAVEIPPAFEDAVRDFITEQLLREPFCTVGTVEEQLLSLLGKVRTVEENLDASVRGVEQSEALLIDKPGGGRSGVSLDATAGGMFLLCSSSCSIPQEPSHTDDASNLISRMQSQNSQLRNLLDSYENYHTLDEIRGHLVNVLSSASARKQDKVVVSGLKNQVKILRREVETTARIGDAHIFEDLGRVIHNYNQSIRGIRRPSIQVITASLHDYFANRVLATVPHDYLASVHHRFENSVILAWIEGCIRSPLSWTIRTFKSLPPGQIIVATLLSVLLVLVRQHRSGASGGTPTPFTTPGGPTPDDSSLTLKVSHIESPLPTVASSAPTVCVDECFEEEFWRSLQGG